MTKAMAVLAIVIVIFGGYKLFQVWHEYDSQKDVKAKEEEAARHFTPQELPGMPNELEKFYATAQSRGAVGIRDFIKAYRARLEDPRLAWIQLDYVVQVAQTDPVEAKKVFAEVKGRVPQNSRVYPRIKELEKTYD